VIPDPFNWLRVPQGDVLDYAFAPIRPLW
jgi:hypothetical protein